MGSATAQAQTRGDVEVRRTVDCVDPIVAPAPTPAAPGAKAEFSEPWQDAFGSSPVLHQAATAVRNRQALSPHTTNSRSPSARITAPPTNSPPEPGTCGSH